MVRGQSISAGRGRRWRAARFRLPSTAWRNGPASFFSSFFYDLAYHDTGAFSCSLWNHAVEGEDGCCQVNIGRHRFQQFRLKQPLTQVEPFEGIFCMTCTTEAGK